MSTITAPETTVKLNSQVSTYTLLLYDPIRPDNYPINVPIGYDVTSLSLSSITEGLEKVGVIIGDALIFEIKVADIKANENILECALLPLSKCRCMQGKLVFYFDKQYLEERESFDWVDETESEEYFYEEVEIFDGCDYHIGRIVERIEVPTGKKIKFITQRVKCLVPEIKIQIVKSTIVDKPFNIPIWQNLMITPEMYQILAKSTFNHEIIILDKHSSLEELLLSDKPFPCRVKNSLRIQDGMVGFVYCLV